MGSVGAVNFCTVDIEAGRSSLISVCRSRRVLPLRPVFDSRLVVGASVVYFVPTLKNLVTMVNALKREYRS